MNVNQITARFDMWISEQYDRLKERLSLRGAFDEDAFHDAYLSVRCGFPDSICIEPDYGLLFARAYKRICKRHISETFVKCNPDELFFNLLPDSAPEPMAETVSEPDRDDLTRRIRNHVKRNYPRIFVFVWESRQMRDMTYQELRAASGLSYQAMRQGIECINADVRRIYAHAI